MRRPFLLVAMVAGFVSTASAQENVTIDIVDARRLMADRFSVPSGVVSRNNECLPLDSGGGRGFHSKKVPCEIFQVVDDVEIERVRSTVMGNPDKATVPIFRQLDKLSFKNCASTPYPYRETFKYTRTDEASFKFTKTLENVREYTQVLDLNYGLKGDVLDTGIKQTDTEQRKMTLTVGKEREHKTTNQKEVEKPISFDVPPWKVRTVAISEKVDSQQIPVTMNVVLKATVFEEIRALNGAVQRRTPIRLLDKTQPEDKRLFDLSGMLLVRGGDRQLDIEISEGDCPNAPKQ